MIQTEKSLFLQAFDGSNSRVPVWFMRQAGRFLPQYRAIKEGKTFWDMAEVPDVAAEVTCLPVDLLGVDAAILFADILTLPKSMGFDISIVNGIGPQIANPVKHEDDLKRIAPMGDVSFVGKAIQLIKKQLGDKTPLIGFAGSPFTVLTYLIEGGSTKTFSQTTKMMIQAPNLFDQLMTIMTDNTIAYINMQREAGIDAFQLFDSWAGVLREAEYRRFVLPHVKRIFDALEFPSIYFLKNCNHLLAAMDETSADFLSVCENVTIGDHPVLNKTTKGVQGNLFTGLLYAPDAAIEAEVNKIITRARATHKRYIFNLGHGMWPDMSPEKTKFAIQCAQKHEWNV